MAFESNYIPKNFESDIYKKWLELKIGNPDIQVIKSGKTHSILMPPPNLTGDLHSGHAFQHYLMDTLSRYARLNGQRNLWFPGVDHAGLQVEGVIDNIINAGKYNDKIESIIKNLDNSNIIELKEVFEKDKKQLAIKLKKTLPQLWLDIAWENVNKWRDNQMKQSSVLGDTPDYDRQLFTLDPKACEMVNFGFREYWEDGLIYKNSYLINWSIGLQTALSDVSGDTDFVTRKDPFVSFFYKLQDVVSNTDNELLNKVKDFYSTNPILVATVRPETIHGDMGIASHPEVLLKQLVDFGFTEIQASKAVSLIKSKDFDLTFGIPELGVNGVKLIISEKVDKNFGTGSLKITPGSDMVDFDIWVNDYEGGEFVRSINKLGLLTDACALYSGQERFQARLNIIFDLGKHGYIPLKEGFVKNDLDNSFNFTEYEKSVAELREIMSHFAIDFDYEHNVTICERSKTIVEPLISDEFFVGMTRSSVNTGLSLQEHGMEGVKEVNFYPFEYQKRARDFLEGIKDWCISRNLL
ncbi:MAG: class I tRNA ligase family protein, partial [Patescibacteria group bacterium]